MNDNKKIMELSRQTMEFLQEKSEGDYANAFLAVATVFFCMGSSMNMPISDLHKILSNLSDTLRNTNK